MNFLQATLFRRDAACVVFMLCYKLSYQTTTEIFQMIKQHGLSAAIALSFLLTACGGNSGGGDQSAPTVTPKPTAKTAGRLVLSDGTDTVYVYDLDDQKINHQQKMAGAVSGVYSSPSHRYAVLVSKTGGQVQFLYSGLNVVKDTLSKSAPKLLDIQLSGSSPTHYRSVSDQLAVFYDGPTPNKSGFDLLQDDSSVSVTKVAYQELPWAHHGVAEPRGEYVLSSFVGKDAEILSQVAAYQVHGDHFHQTQILDTPCAGLHGAGSTKDFSAFGCTDGVLIAKQNGSKFDSFKVPSSIRISSIISGDNLPTFGAFASGSQQFFVIDPVKKTINAVDWAKGAKNSTDGTPVKRLQYVLSQDQLHLYILDSMGAVHILDTATWQPVPQSPILKEALSTDLVQTRLAVSADTLFITDAVNRLVLTVDTAKLQETGRIHVPFNVNMISWLGIKAAS